MKWLIYPILYFSKTEKKNHLESESDTLAYPCHLYDQCTGNEPGPQ